MTDKDQGCPVEAVKEKPRVETWKTVFVCAHLWFQICCACPDTRLPRDNCIVENGPEKCAQLIRAHNLCLRALGFKVSEEGVN